MNARRRIHTSLAVALLALAAPLAHAQGQAPTAGAERPPIKLLVGFPPGGSADVIARLLAERLREPLGGQSVVVENKPGAAGRIAIDAVKNAAPDGLTLLVAPSGPFVLFPHVFKKLAYDPARDFAPVSQLASFQFAVVSGPRSNVRTVAQMVAQVKDAKSDPGLATYGTSGNGTVPHFLGVMLADIAGVPLQHVPFQGGAPAMNALLGGHVGYNIDVLFESLEQHRAGKVRVLAVSGAQRSPLLPDVPTLREQGVAMDATAWFGLWGPAAMPPAQVQRLSQAVAQVMKDPAVSARMASLGLEPIGSTPEQLATVQRADLQKWAAPVKASGYQAD